MAKPPQFFEKPLLVHSDWAKYELPGEDLDGGTATILVECVAGRGNVPRDAAATADFAAASFTREFEHVTRLAAAALDSFRALKIRSGSIEFGVELGGELRVPLITKGDARANFKVTLNWDEGSAEPVR
jgi:hypothetical protein